MVKTCGPRMHLQKAPLLSNQWGAPHRKKPLSGFNALWLPKRARYASAFHSKYIEKVGKKL